MPGEGLRPEQIFRDLPCSRHRSNRLSQTVPFQAPRYLLTLWLHLFCQARSAALARADEIAAWCGAAAANRASSQTLRNALWLDTARILGAHPRLHRPLGLSTTAARVRSDARGCGLRGLSGSSVDPPQDVSLKTRFQMMAKDYGKVIVVSKALSLGAFWLPSSSATHERVCIPDGEWLVQLSHSTIWAGSLLATWLAIKSMDMTHFLSLLPAGVASHVDPSAGAFAIAFVLVKLTGYRVRHLLRAACLGPERRRRDKERLLDAHRWMVCRPARLMVDIAITPMLARVLRRTWLAGPLGLDKAGPPASKLQVSRGLLEGSRKAQTRAGKRLDSMRQRVAESRCARGWQRLSASLAVTGTRTRVSAVIRKAIPRLQWVRLRKDVSTPLTAASSTWWRARTWQVVAHKLRATRAAANHNASHHWPSARDGARHP